MNTLTNSLRTSIPYSKTWVDSEGDPITGDYLNLGELSVSFTLQVREKDAQNAQWQDADVYFKANLADTTWEKLFAGYDFTAQLPEYWETAKYGVYSRPLTGFRNTSKSRTRRCNCAQLSCDRDRNPLWRYSHCYSDRSG